MPIRLPVHCKNTRAYIHKPRRSLARHATAQAVVPAPDDAVFHASQPIKRYPSLQPPSHKAPEARRSQLHRQYTSLLKSTPLMLVFQHNNLKTQEWLGLRRELKYALQRIDDDNRVSGQGDMIADHVKIQVIQGGVFGAALRVSEYFDSTKISEDSTSGPRIASLAPVQNASMNTDDAAFRHSLSRTAYEETLDKRSAHPLMPLLNGPVAILTFPTVSTTHLKAALSILAPSPPSFPAPTRRASPGWHEPAVQSGVQKLLLLGARIEGSVFDNEKTRWVGTISGGVDGLRAQLVSSLQAAGAAVTHGLEAATRSIYFTLEGRKAVLEEEDKKSTEA